MTPLWQSCLQRMKCRAEGKNWFICPLWNRKNVIPYLLHLKLGMSIYLISLHSSIFRCSHVCPSEDFLHASLFQQFYILFLKDVKGCDHHLNVTCRKKEKWHPKGECLPHACNDNDISVVFQYSFDGFCLPKTWVVMGGGLSKQADFW